MDSDMELPSHTMQMCRPMIANYLVALRGLPRIRRFGIFFMSTLARCLIRQHAALRARRHASTPVDADLTAKSPLRGSNRAVW